MGLGYLTDTFQFQSLFKFIYKIKSCHSKRSHVLKRTLFSQPFFNGKDCTFCSLIGITLQTVTEMLTRDDQAFACHSLITFVLK